MSPYGFDGYDWMFIVYDVTFGSGQLNAASVNHASGVVRPKFLFKNSLFITKIIVELNFRETNIIHVVLTKKNYHL